jgi:hypothetical protein
LGCCVISTKADMEWAWQEEIRMAKKTNQTGRRGGCNCGDTCRCGATCSCARS